MAMPEIRLIDIDKPVTQALIKFGISMFGSEPLRLDIKPRGADEQWCEKHLAGRHWSEVTLFGFLTCREYFYYGEPEGSYLCECTRFHLPGFVIVMAACRDSGNADWAYEFEESLCTCITADKALWSKRTAIEKRALASILMFSVGYAQSIEPEGKFVTNLLDNIRTLDEE